MKLGRFMFEVQLGFMRYIMRPVKRVEMSTYVQLAAALLLELRSHYTKLMMLVCLQALVTPMEVLVKGIPDLKVEAAPMKMVGWMSKCEISLCLTPEIVV